jgi:hypothetical protein
MFSIFFSLFLLFFQKSLQSQIFELTGLKKIMENASSFDFSPDSSSSVDEVRKQNQSNYENSYSKENPVESQSSTALSRARDRISSLTLLVSTTEEKNKMMEIEVCILFIFLNEMII